MATGAGAGYNVPDIDAKVAVYARRCIEDNADDDICAAALKAKIEADGGTITDAKALKLVQAIREMTYWAMSFAPTHTLDVRGPTSLI